LHYLLLQHSESFLKCYTYAYDQKGNRTARTLRATGAVDSYAYDAMNRLTGFTPASGPAASYRYDALGRRIARTAGGVTTAHVYDIGAMDDVTAHDRLIDFRAGVPVKRWLHGQGVDEPLGYESYTANATPGAGTVYALHADRQGSVIAVTAQATGQLAARYAYDAFGQRTATVALTDQDVGFTGREYDAESGLYHYRARTYDPASGRFLQSDPLGFAAGDLNLYAYTWNDPANWTDPSGLTARKEKGVLAAASAAMARYAVSSAKRGAECLAYKVSTMLQAIGEEIARGGDPTKVVISQVAECVMEAVMPCPCGGSGKMAGGGRGGRSSFPAGTPVLTPRGPKAIEDLREGDLVVARDEATGVSGVFPVTALMGREARDVLWLTLERGDGVVSRMGVTSAHPLFVAGDGWTQAADIAPGDVVRDKDLSPLTVLAVELDPTPQIVHNLEVADAATYFAGELEAWGHNRKQISLWFSSRKKSKDAAARFCPPIPSGLSGSKLKKLLSERKGDGPDAFGAGTHFHDRNRDNTCKPNIHYRSGGRRG
jgi:RHS repeat-associated protein